MQQYQHTGGITLAGIVWGFGAGILGAFLFSIPYAYATFYLPVMETHLVGAAILGVLVGICAAKGASIGKAQSRPAYLALGFVSGLSAVYFSWAFWIFVVSGHKLLTFDPLAIHRIARGLLPFWAWEIHGKEIKGLTVVCGWIAEAAAIASIAAVICRGCMKTFICCPVCRTRFRSATASRHYVIPENISEVIDRLCDFDFTCLSDLTEVDMEESDDFLTLDLYLCPTCSGFGLLHLESLQLQTIDNELISRRATLLDHVVIPPEKLHGLRLRATSEVS
jgi:uncharacterized protein YbaR (Trm112 family)